MNDLQKIKEEMVESELSGLTYDELYGIAFDSLANEFTDKEAKDWYLETHSN
jgi:hypothetical protein